MLRVGLYIMKYHNEIEYSTVYYINLECLCFTLEIYFVAGIEGDIFLSHVSAELYWRFKQRIVGLYCLQVLNTVVKNFTEIYDFTI